MQLQGMPCFSMFFYSRMELFRWMGKEGRVQTEEALRARFFVPKRLLAKCVKKNQGREGCWSSLLDLNERMGDWGESGWGQAGRHDVADQFTLG
jgi:hypothetical protein